MARTTPAEKAIMSAIQERAAAEASVKAKAAEEARDQVDHAGQPPAEGEQATAADEPRVSRLLTKTIMVATAAMLLCGAVTAFSVRTTESPRFSPSTPAVGPVKITGPALVRPDLLNKQLAAGLPTTIRSAGLVAIPGDLVAGDDVRAERLSEPVARASETGIASQRAEQVRKVIREFYATAPELQHRAFELLGPQMRGDGEASFRQSWQTNNKDTKLLVQVPVLEIGNGGVAHITVVIAWPDATVLWTEQLLVVSEGPDPKIVRGELFAAHRG